MASPSDDARIASLHARLVAVAGRGDEGALRALLEHPPAPAVTAALSISAVSDGSTVLWHAAKGGHAACVRLLLSRGADAHAGGGRGWHPLHRAAGGGHGGVLRALLSVAPPVNPSVRHAGSGATPLHTAAAAGRAEALQLLLAAGAQVNACRKDGSTALHWAAYFGHERCVTLLLDAGADPALSNAAGQRPADVCRLGGHALERLRQAAADADDDALRCIPSPAPAPAPATETEGEEHEGADAAAGSRDAPRQQARERVLGDWESNARGLATAEDREEARQEAMLASRLGQRQRQHA